MGRFPKRVNISISLAISFYLLIKLYPIWSRILPPYGNSILQLIGIIIAATLLGTAVLSLVLLFVKKNYRKFSSYLPILIVPIVFSLSLYSPLNIDLNNLYGEVLYRACYEGTQNQATLVLREENKVEIHWTGVFLYDEYFTGTFEQNEDTLHFEFKDQYRPRNFGNKALLDKGKGITWFDENNQLIGRPFFYEGKCKGLN